VRKWLTVRIQDNVVDARVHYAETYFHHEQGVDSEAGGDVGVTIPENIVGALRQVLEETNVENAAKRVAIQMEARSAAMPPAPGTIQQNVGGTIGSTGGVS